MADTISGVLPEWLERKAHFTGSNAVSQDIRAGLQYAQQQRELAQRDKALALQQQAFQLRQDAELDVSQGMVELGQVVSEIAKTGDWTSPENRAKFYAAAAKHPHTMKSPAFKSLEENFQLADKAKANEALWSNRLEVQQDIAGAKVQAQLEAQQNRLDSMIQMEGLKDTHRKELETLRNDFQLLRDSLKPTRTGQLVHDLPEADLVAMRSELSALDKMYEKGGIQGKSPGLFRKGESTTKEQEYQKMRQEILKKYDAKRIGTPTPAAAAEKRVRVQSPDGKIGNIPESELQEALSQGYKAVP